MTVAEKNWKDHSEIHCARRNRMKPEKTRDLVFASTSLRLQEQAHKIQKEKNKPAGEAAAMANEDLDDFDEEDDEV